MAAMEVLAGVMVATHLLHHQVVLQHALLHQATCLHGELHQPLGQGIIHQVFPWVDLLPHHQEEKVPLDQAAVEHHLVDGACLHGVQHPHLLLGELQPLALFHHLLVVEVLHLPCPTGTRVEVEAGVDKLTHSQTFSVLHHHHPHLAKHKVHQKRLCGDLIEV